MEVENKNAELNRANNAIQHTGRDLINERAKNEETEKRLQEAEENLGRILLAPSWVECDELTSKLRIGSEQ